MGIFIPNWGKYNNLKDGLEYEIDWNNPITLGLKLDVEFIENQASRERVQEKELLLGSRNWKRKGKELARVFSAGESDSISGQAYSILGELTIQVKMLDSTYSNMDVLLLGIPGTTSIPYRIITSTARQLYLLRANTVHRQTGTALAFTGNTEYNLFITQTGNLSNRANFILDGIPISSQVFQGSATGPASYVGDDLQIGHNASTQPVDNIYIARAWDRILPQEEIDELEQAPYSILKPRNRFFAIGVVANPDILGTLSYTESQDQVNIPGTIPLIGNLTSTETSDTLTSTGSISTIGTLAYSETLDSVKVLSGTAISGDLGYSETSDNVVSSGNIELTGLLVYTESSDSVSSTGNINLLGNLLEEETSDSVASSGTIPVSGSLDLTETSDSIVISGNLISSGSLNYTESSDKVKVLAAGGVVAITGDFLLVESSDGVLSIVKLLVQGDFSSTETSDSLSSSGNLPLQGTLSLVETLDSFSSTASVKLLGNSLYVESQDSVSVAGNLEAPVIGTVNLTESSDDVSVSISLEVLGVIKVYKLYTIYLQRAPQRVHIYRKRGNTQRIVFRMLEKSNKPLDLTGWGTLKLTVGTLEVPVDNTTTIFTVTGSILDPVKGLISFIPPGTPPSGEYFYNASAIDFNSELITFVSGKFNLTQEIIEV